MNPSTIERLALAWDGPWVREVGRTRHILRICGESGCWPQTVYTAAALGYLRRTDRAHFAPTQSFVAEIERIERIRYERSRR